MIRFVALRDYFDCISENGLEKSKSKWIRELFRTEH